MKSLVLLLIMMLLALGGCAFPSMNQTRAGTYTVTDDSGRLVSISRRPERIVSITYGADEILWDLVDHRRIRALCRYAGDEGITFITKADRAEVGRTVEGNLESIIAEKPDLVFVTAGTGSEVIDSLTDMGIPVYVTIYPKKWSDLEEKIMGIARAVKEEEKGKNLVSAMNGRRDAVMERLKELPEGKERTALALSFSGVVGRKGTLFADMMAMDRVKNEAGRIPVEGEGAIFTKEAVIAADPEVLLLPTWNFNGRSNAANLKKDIENDPAYAPVKAVKEGRLVYVEDRYRYVTSHHAAEALEAIAKAVYPELWQ